MIELPESLSRTFAVRGYYGTVNHNSKAVYQHYFGFFDGNPANLHPLPPEEAGPRYVDFMGGAAAVLEKSQAAYDRGEYRFVAMVLNHLVFAEPENHAARRLLADAYDQLAYQAESGPWRDFYLTGAQELRYGMASDFPLQRGGTVDIIGSVPMELFFDALAVRLNGPEADGKEAVLNFVFTDIGETHVLVLENAVLHHSRSEARTDADTTVKMTREIWNRVVAQETTFQAEILSGNVDVDGSRLKLLSFFSLLDDFAPGFEIVRP
jgi:alkyl sulfatase BDS1-like metallo-beta-lactamase superfamily hydrolase